MAAVRPGGRNSGKPNMKHISLAFAFMFLALAGCTTTGGNHQPRAMDDKQLVTRFFEQFSSGNIDAAFALVSDDASWWVPGDLPFSGTKTKAEYLQIVSSIQKGFPNGLKLDATAMIAEGGKFAVEVSSYGEHVSGKIYTNKYHFLITVKDGKLTEVKEYMDTLHLFQLIQP
jgi:ketosteroid isomerase-like protein